MFRLIYVFKVKGLKKMTVTKGRRGRGKVNHYWFTAICAYLSKRVGMLALLRMRNNAFFYEEPVWSTAHEDVTAVLLPAQLLRFFIEKPNASSMSSWKLGGAHYRKRKAKQEQEAQKSEKLLRSFLTKRTVEQSETSSKIQMLVDLELVDPEERSVHLTQGWANSGPRAKCGPPQRFQWPAEGFRKYVQIWNFLQLITVNASAEGSLTKTCFFSIRRYGPLLNADFSKWPPGQINCPPLI